MVSIELATPRGMGAHALVHGGFYDGSPSDGLVERMAATGTYLATTFSVIDAQSIEFHPERLDDALVRRTVPPVELATARNPASGRFLATAQIGMVEPWLPDLLHGPLARCASSSCWTRPGFRRWTRSSRQRVSPRECSASPARSAPSRSASEPT